MQTAKEKAKRIVDAFFSGKAEEPVRGYEQKAAVLRDYLKDSVL